jgi:hypothetical protein
MNLKSMFHSLRKSVWPTDEEMKELNKRNERIE